MTERKKAGRMIQLPRAEEQLLAEELAGSGRSDASIILEALRLRRAVLEALGIQSAGTQPGEIAELAAKAIKRGQRKPAV